MGFIEGFRVGRDGVHLSHLLFVDNTSFFFFGKRKSFIDLNLFLFFFESILDISVFLQRMEVNSYSTKFCVASSVTSSLDFFKCQQELGKTRGISLLEGISKGSGSIWFGGTLSLGRGMGICNLRFRSGALLALWCFHFESNSLWHWVIVIVNDQNSLLPRLGFLQTQ